MFSSPHKFAQRSLVAAFAKQVPGKVFYLEHVTETQETDCATKAFLDAGIAFSRLVPINKSSKQEMVIRKSFGLSPICTDANKMTDFSGASVVWLDLTQKCFPFKTVVAAHEGLRKGGHILVVLSCRASEPSVQANVIRTALRDAGFVHLSVGYYSGAKGGMMAYGSGVKKGRFDEEKLLGRIVHVPETLWGVPLPDSLYQRSKKKGINHLIGKIKKTYGTKDRYVLQFLLTNGEFGPPDMWVPTGQELKEYLH